MKRGINKIHIFEYLDKDVKEKLSKIASIKEYKKGALIYSAKEKLNSLYFVLEGVCALYKPNSDNTKKVVFILGPGDVLNEVIIYDNRTRLSCETLAPTKIMEISRDKFVEVLENNYPLAKGVIESLIYKNRTMSHQIKNTSNSVTVDRQIAFKLWKLARDFGIETELGLQINFDLPITYLAEMLGAKRETVSRQVKVLCNLGLINVSKKRFTVLKHDELLKYFKRDEL